MATQGAACRFTDSSVPLVPSKSYIALRLLFKIIRNDFDISPIKSVSSRMVGKVVLKMGLFPRLPAPEAEAFSEQKQEWEGVMEGIIHYRLGLGEDIQK
jgi:hypothetical protein